MLKDLVLKNRSFRGYDESRIISREELLELVDLTRYTASSTNKQALKYYISCEREETEAILSNTKWARALAELNLPYPGTHPTAFIIICQDMEISENIVRFMRDSGIVAQTMLLAATEKGLGGCMIGNFNKGAIKELLGLADNIEPTLVVALGKPSEKIVLTDVGPDGNTDYYRKGEGSDMVHYVPKRSLQDIVINKE